jgi:hypothetical protein
MSVHPGTRLTSPSPGRSQAFSLERIESESESPNLATENNASLGVFGGPNSQSPVRLRQCSTAKTPRNRGNFSGKDLATRGKSLQQQTRWRREWDSNPRYPYRYTRFPSVRLQPLGHLSGSRRKHPGTQAKLRPMGQPPCASNWVVAEREGFEPSIGVNLYTLSRGAPSATRPPLRERQRILTHAAPSPPPARKEPDFVPISRNFELPGRAWGECRPRRRTDWSGGAK